MKGILEPYQGTTKKVIALGSHICVSLRSSYYLLCQNYISITFFQNRNEVG